MLKIVLTGGPSSGKTSVLNRIREVYSTLGYNCIIVPETATDLINSGIRPFGDNAVDIVKFQDLVLKTQLSKESVAEDAAKLIGEDKSIIIYDRGLLDGYAYVSDKEWDQILERNNLDKQELLNRYDGVMYLKSAEEFFTKENNAARYESDATEAIEKGRRVLRGYLSHDNLMVIKPREKLEDKLDEVISTIHNLLGNPIPTKDQRKYLVDTIDIEKLNIEATKVEIEQMYLDDLVKEDEEHRIRKIKQGSSVSYHYTVKRMLEDGTREILREMNITEAEYKLLSMYKNSESDIIKKVRYSFVYQNQFYKLDLFENGLIMLEVNVTKENPIIEIPNFINAIDEVTNRNEYRNSEIARRRETTYGKRKNYSN